MHELFFLLRGVRHMPPGTEECIEALAPRDRLFCMLDFQNPHNPRAVALRTEELRILGSMPDYAVADVDALRQARGTLEIFVERVNPSPAPRHHRYALPPASALAGGSDAILGRAVPAPCHRRNGTACRGRSWGSANRSAL